MKCSQERSAQLMEYAEGNLPVAEAADLEMHLSGCSSCREELASWRQLEARLRAFSLVAEPAGFKAAVMSRVAAPKAAVPVPYRAVDPMAALALGAVLLGLAALLSGAGDWEFQFAPAYWLDLAHGLASPWLAMIGAAVSGLLAQLAASIYASLLDSMPVLAAALLLALFALGPSEIMSTVGVRSRQS